MRSSQRELRVQTAYLASATVIIGGYFFTLNNIRNKSPFIIFRVLCFTLITPRDDIQGSPMLKQVLIAAALTGLLAQGAQAGNSAAEQQNKINVIAFYNKALNDKDFNAARPFIGAEYRQHNPDAKDGVKGLQEYIAYLKAHAPASRSEIKQAFVDGDYVILHVKATDSPVSETQAVIDIFRLNAEHKIVEHWDTIQQVPKQAANGNGMFTHQSWSLEKQPDDKCVTAPAILCENSLTLQQMLNHI